MATITTLPGQISTTRRASPGEIVTLTPAAGGTAVLQYTQGSLSDIANNVATWTAWPFGVVSAATSQLIKQNMYIRVLATTTAATLVTNPNPSPSDLLAFDTPFYTPNTTAANVVKLGGANGTPGSNAVGTGTQTTFPIGTIAIPAGSLNGNNGVLTVVVSIGANNSASVKTVTTTLNSQDLGVTYQMANASAGEVTIRIQNKNATNAQQVRNTSAPTAAATQTTVDMTQAQNITILGTLTTSGDTMNVTGYSWNVSNV